MRLVPGIPPLRRTASTNETYQISLVVIAKFEVSETGQALDGFEEGLFAMRLHGDWHVCRTGLLRRRQNQAAGIDAAER